MISLWSTVQNSTEPHGKKKREAIFLKTMDNEKGLSFFTDLFTGIHNRPGLFMAFSDKKTESYCLKYGSTSCGVFKRGVQN